MEEHLYSMILIIVYVALVLTSGLAVYLYRKAYYQMKRTRMILSVYLLLFSIFIENIFFGLAALFRDHYNTLYEYLMHPISWCIPKVFMLYALVYFIFISLSQNEYDPKKVSNKDKI